MGDHGEITLNDFKTIVQSKNVSVGNSRKHRANWYNRDKHGHFCDLYSISSVSKVQLIRHNASRGYCPFSWLRSLLRSLKPELRKRSCHAVSLCSLTRVQGGIISVGTTHKLGLISNGVSAAKIYVRKELAAPVK